MYKTNFKFANKYWIFKTECQSATDWKEAGGGGGGSIIISSTDVTPLPRDITETWLDDFHQLDKYYVFKTI